MGKIKNNQARIVGNNFHNFEKGEKIFRMECLAILFSYEGFKFSLEIQTIYKYYIVLS